MAEATWGPDDEDDEPLIHTKEELVRALFRANRLIEGKFPGSITEALLEMNSLMAQHARFMREGEEYLDFQKVKEKLEMEDAVG